MMMVSDTLNIRCKEKKLQQKHEKSLQTLSRFLLISIC
jgi:hypothetical protein